MFPLIRDWEQSEEDQKAFCTRHGIKAHIFWYWLRRYRDRSTDQGQEARGFIPVKVEESKEGSTYAEIIYPNGTRLVLNQAVEVKFLQGLLPKR
jgi:transposase-like protein